MKKKACKKCKLFVEGASCPVCKNNQFSTNWQGRIIILNKDKSISLSEIWRLNSPVSTK